MYKIQIVTEKSRLQTVNLSLSMAPFSTVIYTLNVGTSFNENVEY
jgi:hypothetical protein